MDLHYVREKRPPPAKRCCPVFFFFSFKDYTEVSLLMYWFKWNQSEIIVLFSVFQKYKSYSPYDMQESIVKEVKGDLQKSFLVLGISFYQ